MRWLGFVLLLLMAYLLIPRPNEDIADGDRSRADRESHLLKPVQQSLAKYDAQFSQIAEIQRLSDSLNALSTEEWLTGTPTRTSARPGLLRLSDADLEDHFTLLRLFLSKMTTDECANFARGQYSREVILSALGQLDSLSVNRWFALKFKALEAEVNDNPAPVTVTDQQVNDAWEVVTAQEPAGELSRLGAILEDPDAHTAADLCWLQHAYYRYIVNLPSDHRNVLLRSAVQASLGDL